MSEDEEVLECICGETEKIELVQGEQAILVCIQCGSDE